MLKISDVTKKLQDTEVLLNCQLEVKDASILGLVGINGAGKSTLMRCIAGIYKVDSGSISFDNMSVYENNLVKKSIFLVDDNPFYERNATIRDIKKFYECFYEFDNSIYKKYLNMFKLNPAKRINNFSKGMKRQVFIVMALAIRPKLLLLDESFDGLDPLVMLNMKKALIDLVDSGSTVIISSHNLRGLEDICDSYALIENNQISASGDIEDDKEKICKFQLAFKDEVKMEMFDKLDLITYQKEKRMVTLVVRGKQEDVVKQLESLNPLVIDLLNISFEELFIYEMMRKGYYSNDDTE